MKKYTLTLFLCLLAVSALAQRVSDLPAVQLPLTGNELMSLDQNGTSKRVTTSSLMLGSLVLGYPNGGTGLSTLGSPLSCLQVNSSGTALQYGACGGGGGGGNPGGTNGQTQYNNFGFFGGYTMSGDCTIVTSTGVITCSTLGGLSPFNASNLSSGTVPTSRLLKATTTTAGVVVAGNGLNVSTTGVLSGLPATTTSLGSVIVGGGLSVTTSGVLSTTSTGGSTPIGPAGGDLGGNYPNPTVTSLFNVTTGLLPYKVIPLATTTSTGAVVPGSGLSVSSTGVLSTTTTTLPPSGSAGGDLGGTYPNPSVASIGNVTTGIFDPVHFLTGQVGQPLYESNSGGIASLASQTLAGIAGVIVPLGTAANFLYAVTQGMNVDPRAFGALCSTKYFNSGYYGNGTHTIRTTAGSPVISIDGYTFKNCISAPGNDCDVGRVISIWGGVDGDAGPTTYIASVDTGANTATLGENMQSTLTTGGQGSSATFGGYPQSSCGVNSSTPSLAADDTCAIHNASTVSAIYHGGKVVLPPNCMVHNLILAGGTILEGNNGGNTYGNTKATSPPSGATPLYFATNNYPEDPLLGINVSNTVSPGPVTLRNIEFISGIFPYIQFFGGAQFACVGATSPTDLTPNAVLLDHDVFSLCPVGFGIPVGFNLPVSFTASISGTTMTVTSIDSSNAKTKYGFTSNWASDVLTAGRCFTGSGVSGGTCITAVPTGGKTGTYTINNSQTVSSESMTSNPNNIFLSGGSEFSAYVQNGFGMNGDMSDFYDVGSVISGNKITGVWMGPNTGGTTGNGANRFSLERVEESPGSDGAHNPAIVLDNSGGDIFTGLNGQFNRYGLIGFVGNYGGFGENQITGGTSQGDGAGATPKAHIMLGATNYSGLYINGMQFQFNDFSAGGTVSYIFGTTTGSSNDYISVEGGDVKDGFVTAMTDFSRSSVAHYKQEAPGIATIDNTQSALSITSTGGVGIGTATPTNGTILDLFSATTTSNSSIGLPKGTTANRPTNVVAGMFRYNTSLNTFEGYNGTQWGAVGGSTVIPFSFGGLTLSNDGAFPNTSIDISSGGAASDDSTAQMTLASALSKTITGTFVAGAGNGCLDTGSVAASTWYTDFLIGDVGNNVNDILCSTSATSPTLPGTYTVKRRIGAEETDGSSHIIAFTQVGPSTFYWATPTLDVTTTSLGTSAALETLNVPPGVQVTPLCEVSISNSLASTTTPVSVYLSSPDETDLATTATSPFTGVPGYSYLAVTTTGTPTNAACPYLTTNTSSQIRARANTAGTTLTIITRGWID